MDLKDFFQMFKIIEYISSNPNCIAPDVKEFLGINQYGKASAEEKRFYYSLKKLEKEGYVYRMEIKKVGSAGAQFSLTISSKGRELITTLKKFSSQSIKDKSKYPDSKTKKIMLDSMLKVFQSESATYLLEEIQEIIKTLYPIKVGLEQEEMTKEEIFENVARIDQQKEIVEKINEIVEELSNKAEEITEAFL